VQDHGVNFDRGGLDFGEDPLTDRPAIGDGVELLDVLPAHGEVVAQVEQAVCDSEGPHRHRAHDEVFGTGVAVDVVNRMLGHARPSITSDIYAHVLPGQGKEAAIARSPAHAGGPHPRIQGNPPGLDQVWTRESGCATEYELTQT